MSNIESHNTAHLRRALEAMGATVREIKQGRHCIVYFQTAEGNIWHIGLPRGYVDPFKVKGWARQAINRANARGHTDRR